MRKKKPLAEFEVYFDGTAVFPEDISVRVLSDTLSAVQRLAAGSSEGHENEQPTIRLLEVKRGSATFRCVTSAPSLVVKNLRSIGRMIARSRVDEESAFLLDPVEHLSRVGRSLNCAIVLRDASGENGVIARIAPDTFEKISDASLVSGDTTTTAYVVRVGGATATRCALRVPDQHRLVFCRIESKSVAQELARFLYKDVIVAGRGTWFRRSLRLHTCNVSQVRGMPAGSISDSVSALREAGGSAWDEIRDPDKFLSEVSGEP